MAAKQRKSEAVHPAIKEVAGDIPVTTSNEIEFMDEAEQENIVNNLRSELKSQSRTTRVPFMILFTILGVFSLWRVLACFAQPEASVAWQSGVVTPMSFEAVVAAYFAQGSALLMAAFVAYGPKAETASLAAAVGGGLSIMPIVLWMRLGVLGSSKYCKRQACFHITLFIPHCLVGSLRTLSLTARHFGCR